jgi:hypothetical protein
MVYFLRITLFCGYIHLLLERIYISFKVSSSILVEFSECTFPATLNVCSAGAALPGIGEKRFATKERTGMCL